MKTIIVTAYDVDPYKGSESGMGWNFIIQASLNYKIIAITRENNKHNIESFMKKNQISEKNLTFDYFDLPKYLRFWKKGQRGSSIYFYLWQLFIISFIKKKNYKFSGLHNLNFHADSFPSFLWLLRKPLIWGPINHHEKINKSFILKQYGLLKYLKDRFIWLIKNILWKLDPFLWLTKKNARIILCGSTAVNKRLNLPAHKCVQFSSVGSEVVPPRNVFQKVGFHVVSVGRFVPLKGFDVTINSFLKFLDENNEIQDASLTLIGKGPEYQRLVELAEHTSHKSKINFIDWIERDKLFEFYNKASVFLFPSHEGAGMVVMEAMSHNLPVICFDNNGPGELIDDSCGVKVPYSDYDTAICNFANALRKFYYEKTFTQSCSESAKKRFNEKFSWPQKGKQLKRIYDEVFYE